MIGEFVTRRLLTPPGEPGLADPQRDPPGDAPVRQVLIIATNPRTGSTLLSYGVGATGLAGVPHEYLLANSSYLSWRRRFGLPVPTARGAVGMLKRRVQRHDDWYTCYRWRPDSMRRLLDQMVAHRTTPNGVFAAKIHAFQHRDWIDHAGLDLEVWGDGSVPVRWVRLERNDVIAQAVSYAIAQQTRQWNSAGSPVAEPAYDADQIERGIEASLIGRRHWDDYFAERAIEPLCFTYEQVVAAYDESVRAVLALLGETVEEAPPPQVERQAGARNREWIERFSEDRPAVVDRATSGEW